MKKTNFLTVLILLVITGFSVKAEVNFDLTTVGGELIMGYDEVSAERLKALEERWITVANFGNSGTAGKCSGVAKTFDIKAGRTIEYFLAACDKMIISANIASGRGLVVNINDGPNISLAGTGACENYEVLVNSEVPVKIKVQGLNSSSAWTSLFTFRYAPKVPSIASFTINGLQAAIDQSAKTIVMEMPFGTNLTALTPVVVLGGTSKGYTPAGAQNFSIGPVVYTVTDSVSATADYTATITAKATPDTEKAITSLTINGRAASIDEATGMINCLFPGFEGPLASWPVVFTLNSVTATTDFVSGTSFDFAANPSLSIKVTAQDNSQKTYIVTPEVSTKKNIALLSVNGKAESYDDLLMSSFADYYVTHLKADATAPASITDFYANYDLIVLHANVSGTNATALATKALVGVKPMLNLKAFFYNSGRWSWSTAAPQNAPAGADSAMVEAQYQNHPVFASVVFTGNKLKFYDNLPVTNANAVQYASDLATLTGMTSYTLATVNTTGIQMHEIQDVSAAKFMMVGLSMENNNYTYFNANTTNILKNAAGYLLNASAAYNYLTTNLDSNAEQKVRYTAGELINPEAQLISVYNLSGSVVLRSSLQRISIDELSHGVYIVKAGDQVLKILK